MDLNEIAIFIKVVQLGSFSQAAKALALPNSTVSSKVSSLEKRLGMTLIQRTTRKLHITPAGHGFYLRCLSGFEEMKAAEQELLSLQGEPKGILRVTAPTELGRILLPDIISRFNREYPKVCVEAILTDRRVDLLSEGVDLAIRAGVLKDSTLIAKKLGSAYFVPVASPKYVKAHGLPKHPRDLKDHQILSFPPMGTEDWKLFSGKGAINATINPRTIMNDLEGLYRMALAGDGIAMIAAYFCIEEVKSGKLVRVLPEWRSATSPVHFVYPGQKFVSPKLQAFMKFAGEDLKHLFIEQDV